MLPTAENTTKCAEALRGQLRLRGHVYKIKNKDVLVGQDKDEAAIARLMVALPAVVAASLPMQPPPPPVPYPKRATHPAPTRAAVVFELKHLAAISTALAELIAVTNEGSFKAPRRRRATAPSAASAAAAAAAAPPTAAGKRPRAPAHDEAALVGVAFEEDGVDWMVLAVEWDTDLEEVVVWSTTSTWRPMKTCTRGEWTLRALRGSILPPWSAPAPRKSRAGLRSRAVGENNERGGAEGGVLCRCRS